MPSIKTAGDKKTAAWLTINPNPNPVLNLTLTLDLTLGLTRWYCQQSDGFYRLRFLSMYIVKSSPCALRSQKKKQPQIFIAVYIGSLTQPYYAHAYSTIVDHGPWRLEHARAVGIAECHHNVSLCVPILPILSLTVPVYTLA